MPRTQHQSNSPDLQFPDRPWRSPGLLPANTPGFSPWVKWQRLEYNLFRSVPRLWMLGATPPVTYTSRWRVSSANGQTHRLLGRCVRSDVALFVPICCSDCGSVKLTVGLCVRGHRGSTVVKVLCYKSEGRWFDPSWCQWIFSLT